MNSKLEKCIKLIESFKENQISKVMCYVSDKMLKIINSQYASSQITLYFREINTEGVPFTHFELEPDNISQIKKLINSLYYARLTFQDLENIDIRNIYQLYENFNLIYSKVVENAYEAGYLLTHLDVDLKALFQEELDFILPYFQQVSNQTTSIMKLIEEHGSSIRKKIELGKIMGTAVDQMRPLGGEVDYNFLTKFSARLPGHINQLTKYIEEFSSQIKQNQPKLNQEKLDELQNAALSLLNDIETLRGNSLFISVKFLNYIHIIRNIITLSMSTLEQIGELSNSSQELICTKLAKLKYTILPTLFGFIDKIEVNSMLKPGTLSSPLMEQLQGLYQALLYLPQKAIDFNIRGKEFLKIEDAHFIELRLKWAYKRIDDANKELHKTDLKQKSLIAFFTVLTTSEYADSCLHQLPQDIKDQLIKHYKIIKPLMVQLDIDFNEQIIRGLTSHSEPWSSYLNPNRWLGRSLQQDHISYVLAKQQSLKNLIVKSQNSQNFHIKLNTDLIKFVHKESQPTLFPYRELSNVFIFDESVLIKIGRTAKQQLKFKKLGQFIKLQNPDQLSSDQALDLCYWFKNKLNKLERAKNAFVSFKKLLEQYYTEDPILKDTLKDRLKLLYGDLQPYFMGALIKNREEACQIDNYIVGTSSTDFTNTINKQTIQILITHCQNYFKETAYNWKQYKKSYEELAQKKFHCEHNEYELLSNTNQNARDKYLIKTTNLSCGIRDFRTEFFALIQLFNKTMQLELTPQTLSGLPYPEMENKNDVHVHLAQGRQTRSIKDLYNSLYHLEGSTLELEKLEDLNLSGKGLIYAKNKKGRYLTHLIATYTHINALIKIVKRMVNDPQSIFIAQELLVLAQNLYHTFQEGTEAYQKEPEEIPLQDSIRYDKLWYVLNAFYISPKHIRKLSKTNYLTPEELDVLHLSAKKATLIIEQLINNSHSYFKLFLQTHNMLRLYNELKQKLNEFATTVHDGVLNNLDQIRPNLLTPMILEADHWEDKLGFAPGTLSEPLRQILDEYYKNLLHPLSLHSEKRINLVCDKGQTLLRISIVEKQKSNSIKNQAKKEKSYKDIVELSESMSQYRNLISKYFAAPEKISEVKIKIQRLYKKVLPKLTQLKAKEKIFTVPTLYPDHHLFDTFCNEGLKEYESHFTELEELVNASHQYYMGLIKTYKIEQETAQEKLDYLTNLKDIQEQEHKLFIEEYTTQAFEKHLNTLCNRQIGLQYMNIEYRNELKSELLQYKAVIISEAQKVKDIDLAIQNLLQEKIKIFEGNNYKDYYHLDSVRNALAQFKCYLIYCTENKNSLFESKNTLDKKSALINSLEEIATNAKAETHAEAKMDVKTNVDMNSDALKKLSINERLFQIKEVIKDPSFERFILAHKHADKFDFAYLKMCFLLLLETLHLSTPTRKKRLDTLNDAVFNPPKIDELVNRFGLFSKPSPTAIKFSPSPDDPQLNQHPEPIGLKM